MVISTNAGNTRTRDSVDRRGAKEQADARLHRGSFQPVVDVEDTADAVLIRAELPGLGPKDFSVEVAPTRVILRGFKSEEQDPQSLGFSYREIGHGSFSRIITLPAVVDPDAVTAGYSDGVLRLILPKTPDSRARRVVVMTDR
jgi:HSP20 family protein